MVKKKLISPSILSADFAQLGNEIQAITQAGADWVHVDVMDGHFVNNITIGVPVVSSIKKFCKIPLDVHLMIENPEKYAEAFIKAGADYLTIHVESSKDPEALLKKIRSLGAKPGITLKPKTSLDTILPFLPYCDLVLVMTVEPGFGGQAFMVDQVSKVDQLRQYIDQNQLSVLIEVDGGVNKETAKQLKNADVLVSGSFIFSQDYKAAINLLKNEG